MRPSRILAALIFLVVVISPYYGVIPGWTAGLATTVWFNALALLGLNLIFGVVGMLAFGQAAFMALPVYGAGVLDNLGVPFIVCIFAAISGSLIIAFLMARIFVRLPGVYLAVGTLGFGYVIEGIARAFPNVTGGASGLVLARGRSLSDGTWYVVSVLALTIGLVIYAWLVRHSFWRRLRTIHHDELAAAVLGIRVSRAKEYVYVIGCSFAIVGGLLRANYVGVIVPEDGGIDRSMEQLGMVMVGGPGHLLGPVMGTGILQWLFVITGYVQRYELLVYGAVFLAAVIYAREGVAGWVSGWWKRLERRLDGPRAGLSATRGHLASSTIAQPASKAIAREGICLSVTGLSKHFDGVKALQDVEFSVRFGEIFTIVGPNGAGKSTLFNIVSGIELPTTGTVMLADRDITYVPICDRASFIGRSFQVARLVPDLTVLENVLVRLDQIAPELTELQRVAIAMEQIESFGLGEIADRPVRELSLGQHKLIDLTRAAVGDPELVLLDEPAVGLAHEELHHLARLLEKLTARGSAVVIVEHNIEFVSGVAQRGIVLDSGRPIALGPVKEILSDAKVNAAYFGALV